MTPRTRLLPSLLCLAMACLSGYSKADGTVAGTGSGGPGAWGAGGSLSVDMTPSGNWSLGVSDDFSVVTGNLAPSRTSLSGLESVQSSKGWETKIAGAYADDTVNHIVYLGPELSLGYTHGAPGRVSSTASATEEADDQDDPPNPWGWSITLDIQYHAYSVDLGSNEVDVLGKNGKIKKVLSPDSTVSLTQLYPNLTLAWPLFAGWLTPSFQIGPYLYNKDPTVVATYLSRRFVGGDGKARISGLAQGLYDEFWYAELDLKLPWQFGLSATYGEYELVAPDTWEQHYVAGLTWQPVKEYELAMSWTDNIIEGTPSPEWTGTVTVTY
jgi:hypothetical protein